eukprot:CAMPEP_0168522542 /NCGR_PEP_ID=MMETSP0405-20121227/9409_1 /TAXON_ID=498012 /ORGANISM="Trichosphaerium sp, Strain Am-I-7 wt" /LENGTH=102 /DNA_ID=CAMNT_0008544163 /DNA_START=246 /DNA_END=550 /DNA_ORIENTATION=+
MKMKIELNIICTVIILIIFNVFDLPCTLSSFHNTNDPVITKYDPEANDAINRIELNTFISVRLLPADHRIPFVMSSNTRIVITTILGINSFRILNVEPFLTS